MHFLFIQWHVCILRAENGVVLLMHTLEEEQCVLISD